MSVPIHATRLSIPSPRPIQVARPHLVTHVLAGLVRKFTLISAPAGFGKITLLSEFAAHSPRPVAWLSLEEGDNDPARFITYLILALQTVQAEAGKEPLPLLHAPPSPTFD